MDTESIPWVEKYRPKQLSDVVLDVNNKIILDNIIEQDHFPNLLLYGPPGTGKTTTIINLINSYQTKYKQNHKGLMIHLNASDERGIDIIRNQIASFVNSSGLFMDGMKFVVLDEVDYMTKNAQQALRYLIQQYSKDIRFCLICNYISRIDVSLQNEFVRLRFCQLPKKDIYSFLNKIVKEEKIDVKKEQIYAIQEYFKSDIRSMINYIQSNHDNGGLNSNIIRNDYWNNFINKIKDNKIKKFEMYNYIINESIIYNIQIKTYIFKFLNYMIHDKKIATDKKWIIIVRNILHNSDITNKFLLRYFIEEIYSLLQE